MSVGNYYCPDKSDKRIGCSHKRLPTSIILQLILESSFCTVKYVTGRTNIVQCIDLALESLAVIACHAKSELVHRKNELVAKHVIATRTL